MYHAFGPAPGADPYDLFVAADRFERQLRLLLDAGWQALDLDGYLAASQAGRGAGAFLVTIDDGFASVADVAAPILARLGVPAVVFVLPALLGRTSAWLSDMPGAPMMTAEEVRRLPAQGVEVGVHGLDHAAVTNLAPAQLGAQVAETRELVAEITGRPARGFAYPFGWHDEPARAAVQAAGYDVGFSLYDDAGRFAISRVDVKPGDSDTTFRAKLLPGYRRAWRTAGAIRPLRRALHRMADRA